MKGIFDLNPLRHFSTLFFGISLSILLAACGGGAGSSSAGTSSAGTGGGSAVSLGATSCGVGNGNNADLVWAPPGTKTDGSPATLTDISSYVVYYGEASRSYAVAIRISDPATTSCTIAGLSTGTYYFAVTVIDRNGNESAYSDEKIRSF
jgi:hypothetical protein